MIAWRMIALLNYFLLNPPSHEKNYSSVLLMDVKINMIKWCPDFSDHCTFN